VALEPVAGDENATFGAPVYPPPLFVIVTEATPVPMTAVAAVLVPVVAMKVTVPPAEQPVPGLSIAIALTLCVVVPVDVIEVTWAVAVQPAGKLMVGMAGFV
jgi:hypothetical protein